MASVIERLKKRAFYPFKLVNGETVHLRALTHNQLKAIRQFQGEDESIGYTIGCCLLEESGEPVFTPLVSEINESPKEFGARVLSEIDFPLDVRESLTEFIFKLSTDPSDKAHEAIVKN